MKVEVEIIPINWEVVEMKPTNDFNRKFDFGLYQIYGNHYSYGQDSLLYIGKARDNTFSQRILNEDRIHCGFTETTISPTSIRLGWISKSNLETSPIEDEKKWKDYIDIAEDLLISTHTPALNSQLGFNLHKIAGKYQGKNIIILNLGDRGNILPEISTIRNSYMFYNHEKPFGFEG
jgi:hypothetical protein